MNIIRNAILMFLSFVPFHAFSQNSYFDSARIVKTDFSIVYGYVERISESDLIFGVHFKKSLEDAKRRGFSANFALNPGNAALRSDADKPIKGTVGSE